MSERKSIDDYEYEVKIHDVEGDNITLLFSEVDGNDGFGVTVHRDELHRMLNDGTFDDWAKERVEERIAALKKAEEERRAKEELRKKLSKLEDMLKGKRLSLRGRVGRRASSPKPAPKVERGGEERRVK